MKTVYVFLSFFISGCAMTKLGKPIDTAKVAAIHKGTTTKAEVIKLLGEPYQRQLGELETWIYLYMEARATVNPLCVVVPFFPVMTNAQSKSTSLIVQFNGDLVSQVGMPAFQEMALTKMAGK